MSAFHFCSTCAAPVASDDDLCAACQSRLEDLGAALGAADPSLVPGVTPLQAALGAALRAHLPAAAFAESGVALEELAGLLASAACGHLAAKLGFVPPEHDVFRGRVSWRPAPLEAQPAPGPQPCRSGGCGGVVWDGGAFCTPCRAQAPCVRCGGRAGTRGCAGCGLRRPAADDAVAPAA